jgi:SAM-dependent methyltransferase
MAGKVNYGNWVSLRLIYVFGGLGLLFLALAFLLLPLTAAAVLFFGVAVYFAYARYLFSPRGGNMQNLIWELVLANLEWNGEGKALDIGCGNGALSIKLARKYGNAEVTGVDYWGERWEYSKRACERNAEAEGVTKRVSFQKASAESLPFSDEFFDAAVSNLVFHEVGEAKDKRELIREALRVVKKGGKFAFQDLFLMKRVYGDKDDIIAIIKSWGITKVEFIPTRDADFIPRALKLPFMLGTIGVITGEK